MKLFKSNLEKATATFEELTKVNKDIEEMNAFAQALVKGEIKSSIQLLGEKPKKENDGHEIEEDESPFSFIEIIYKSRAKSITGDLKIAHELNEKLTLELLSVMMKAKQEYKEKLVKQLQRYGLKV